MTIVDGSGGNRVGVYIDVANITMNGGRGMRYDVLRDFACRDGSVPMRLNAYMAYDEERAREDFDYRHRTQGFHSRLRDFGFKCLLKPTRWYTDEEGYEYPKANVDLEMGIDAILQADGLERVILVTGDGDFVRVVQALQNKACRVEAIAFQSVSRDLRETVDFFFSGYLVPDLLPVSRNWEDRATWGEVGSRVRGTIYRYNAEGAYGFVRYLKDPEDIGANLWRTDTRHPRSPWRSAFVHRSQLPSEIDPDNLPSREIFVEFELAPPRNGDSESPEAINVELAGRI